MKKILLAALLLASSATPVLADGNAYKAPWQSGGGHSNRPGFEPRNQDWDRDADGHWGYDDRGYGRRDDRYRDSYTYRRGDRDDDWLDGEAYGLLDRWAMWHFDGNRDGRLSRREYEASRRSFWAWADRNRDGRISDKEWRTFRSHNLRRGDGYSADNGWNHAW